MKRALFAVAVPVLAILAMYALWGGRPHARAELGVGGYVWLSASFLALLSMPLHALLYPWWRHRTRRWPEVLTWLPPVAATMLLAYGTLLAIFLLE